MSWTRASSSRPRSTGGAASTTRIGGKPKPVGHPPSTGRPHRSGAPVASAPTAADGVQPFRAVIPPQETGPGNASTWTIPLQVTISIGVPILATTQAHALVQAPAPAAPRRAPAEGLFGRQSPLPTSQLTYPFSVPSLSATAFDWRATLSLALASRLAYEGRAAVESTAQTTWNLLSCEFLEVEDSTCFVAWTSDVALVAFRGTESLGDWLADLDMVGSRRPYGVVHRGFLNAFRVVDAQLRLQLSGLAGHTVLVTGHSLGGALATVAAAEWVDEIGIDQIYTFGQPAVGKAGFPAYIEAHYAGRFFRFVNDDDIVPQVPPTYQHVGH